MKSTKKVSCLLLSGFLAMSPALQIQAATPLSQISLKQDLQRDSSEGILFEDDFDAYPAGAWNTDVVRDDYVSAKGASIAEIDGTKALAIQDGTVEMAVGKVNKQLEFDFQYDKPYSSWGGMFIKIYKNANSSRDYYFSLNPNFSTKMFISSGTGNLAQNYSKQMDAKTWYSCKAVLDNKKISVKVWPRGEAEPEAWDLEYTNDAFNEADGSGSFQFESASLGSGTTTYFDNVVIRDLDSLKDTFTINASSSDDSLGTVTGGGSYKLGSTVSLTAAPKEGARFAGWKENGEIVSRKLNYTFEAVENRTLTAEFVEMDEPAYTYFEDDYESYEQGELTKDKLPGKYISVDKGFGIGSRNGSQVLTMNTVDGGNKFLTMDCGLVDKQVQFDFFFEDDFTSHDGFYIELHSQPNGKGGFDTYYFSINPNFDRGKLIISCNTQNLKFASKTITKQKWYTCKSRMVNGQIMVKVWERDQAEPAGWDNTTPLSGFDVHAEDTRFRVQYVDRNHTIDSYMDNFSIKTWEKLAEKAEYSIRVLSNDDSMGSVYGGGQVPEGNEVTLKAEAKEGYRFLNWTDEEGEVVSEEATFTLTPTKDQTYTANFEEVQLEINSFMGEGLTTEPEIDPSTKTIKLRFASDVDLSTVRPFFGYNVDFNPEQKPYEVMDLSSGSFTFNNWTVEAEQNTLMQEFYVNQKKGSDSADGSEAHPFASIEKAKEAAAAIENWTGDVIIHIASGEYVLDDTLSFDENDGAPEGYSILYKGEGPNDTIISGGTRLNGWEPSDDVPGVENVYEVQLPEGTEYSRDLFAGGKKADLASGNLNQGEISNRNSTGYTLSGSLANMADWRNQSDIEFVYDVKWTSNILPVTSITRTGNTSQVVMKPGPFAISAKGTSAVINKPNIVQNAFEVLDEPNEFYFDREANKIYYVSEDGVDPDDLVMVVPHVEKLIEVRGTGDKRVNGLGFEDLGFRYTSFMRPHIDGQVEQQAGIVRDPSFSSQGINHDDYLKTPGGVTAAYAKSMRVNHCSFALLAAGGFDYEEGVVSSSITASSFEQIGGSGIQIGGVKVRDAQPFNEATYVNGILDEHAGADPQRVTEKILVASNSIDRVGLNFRGSLGIFAGYVRDLTISHNVLTNISYSGISIGWGWGLWDQGGRADFSHYYQFDTPGIQARYVVENNNISSCMQRLNDGGAIYTLSYMPGSIIRGNFIHDIPNPFGAIYLDEGAGGFDDISENVVYRVYRPYFYHRVAHYTQYEQDSLAVQHDNFFTAGDPVNDQDPAFVAIRDRAGELEGMESEPVADPVKEPDESDVPEEGINKFLLQQAVSYAKAAMEDEAYDKVNELVKAELESALAEAEDLLASDSATQEEVNASWIRLTNAVHMLGFTSDKAELKEVIAAAEAIEAELDKWQGDKEAFLAALNAAREADADPKALDERIAKCVKDLQEAMKALTRVENKVDLSLLQLLEEEAGRMEENIDAYAETGKAEFLSALEQARAVLALENDPELTQEQVDEACINLHGTILNLRLKADESLLEALRTFCADVDDLDWTLYSPRQKTMILSVKQEIDTALAAHDDNTASLSQADAEALLAKAKEARAEMDKPENKSVDEKKDPIQEKPADKTNPVEDTTKKDVAEKSAAPATKNSVKTASSTDGFWFMTLAAAALGGLICGKRRNNR